MPLGCLCGLVGLLMTAGAGEPGTPSVWVEDEAGSTGIFALRHAPYPHPSRAEGFQRNDASYPANPHYVDDSVALFVPRGYRPGPTVDLLYFFHGHGNSVRQALEQFDLRGQVLDSGRNVILVFPEGPKNAADSGLGKLEDPGGLKRLTAEVLEVLKREGHVTSGALGRVILSGHSGAYRGIALGLRHGGLEAHVSQVFLLDASYALLDDFAAWAARVPEGRLRSAFTDHLAGENDTLVNELRQRGLRPVRRPEAEVTDELLRQERLLFIHTPDRDHDGTVGLLERWLRTSGLPAR